MGRIIIPDANPVKFVTQNKITSDDQILYDKYNYADTIRSYENGFKYSQKWAKGDSVNLQFWAEEVNIQGIDLIECTGHVVQTFLPVIAISDFIVNGKIYDIVQFTIPTVDIPVGEYYFRLRFKGLLFANPVQYEISEPQSITGSLPNSILYRYKNSCNNFNTIFKTSTITDFVQEFYFRVEGVIVNPQEESNIEVYEDQLLDLTLLDAKPFTTWTFSFGLSYGLPEWVGRKLSMIRSCDTVFVDGEQWTFEGKLDKAETKFYRRYGYKIGARKKVVTNVKMVETVTVDTPCELEIEDISIVGVSGPAYKTSWTNSNGQPAYVTLEFSTDNITWQPVNNAVFNSGLTECTYDIGTGLDTSHYLRVTPMCSFVDYGLGAETFYERACVPVSGPVTQPVILPAATVGIPWAATIQLFGSLPFFYSGATGLPAWMTAVVFADTMELSGTPDTDTDVSVLLTINNGCGSCNVQATLVVNTAASCIPVGYIDATLPNAIAGTSYNATLNFTGSAPFMIVSQDIPVWMTANIVGSDVQLSGTVPGFVGDSYTVQLTITNDCGSVEILEFIEWGSSGSGFTAIINRTGGVLNCSVDGGVGPFNYSFFCDTTGSGVCNNYSIDNPYQTTAATSASTGSTYTNYVGAKYKFYCQVVDSLGNVAVSGFWTAPNCLVPGTMIMLNDGTEIELKDVVKGQMLFGENEVLAASAHVVDELYIINDGLLETSDGHVNILWCGLEMISKDLRVGQFLEDKNGDKVRINSIEILKGKFDVVNISTANKTYIANGMLTHNKITC